MCFFPTLYYVGWPKVGLQGWVPEKEFILLLCFISYNIVCITTVKLLLLIPLCRYIDSYINIP